MRYLLAPCVLAAISGALLACAPRPAEAPASAPPVEDDLVPHTIETTNYTPFETVIGNGAAPDGTPFVGAALKLTFAEAKDGESKLIEKQRGFNAGGVIDELPAFRAQGEIYLVSSGPAPAEGSLFINETKVDLGAAEWIIKDRAYGLAALTPYLQAGDTVTVSMPGSSLAFAIPSLFSPFVLPRYRTGAMMPTPLRADTMIIDLRSRELSIVYRATLPADPALSSVEFRLISDPIEPWPGETLESTRAKFLAQQRRLRACPIPAGPIEPCALPDHLPPSEFFE